MVEETMAETFEQLVARINRNAFVPTPPKGESKMAKSVKVPKGKEFTFSKGAAFGAQASKYPWDEWFAPLKNKDGSLVHANGMSDLLCLEQSAGTKDEKGNVTTVSQKRDYEVDTNAMPGKIRFAARKKYKLVEISRKDFDGTKLVDSIIFRARDMTPSERVEEDALRAEEDAERKASMAKKRADAKAAAATANATPAATPSAVSAPSAPPVTNGGPAGHRAPQHAAAH